MHQATIAAFTDELEKLAKLTPKELAAIGMVGLPLGVSIYDLFKSRGVAQDSEKIKDLLRGRLGATVDVKKYLSENAPEVTLIDSPEKTLSWMNKELPEHMEKLTLRDKEDVAREVFRGHTDDNLAINVGKTGAYLFCATSTAPVDVIEHELGHMRDYKEKGLTMDPDRKDPYSEHKLLQLLWKPSFLKRTYAAEVNAWSKAKDSPTKKELQDLLLNSYEKSFHQRRGAITGGLIPLATIGAATILSTPARTPPRTPPLVSPSWENFRRPKGPGPITDAEWTPL